MYDLAVIGGGPGGYVAAIKGAQEGLKVLLVEKDSLGGTCLNRGCIPTKSLIYDSRLLNSVKASSLLKGTESVSLDVAGMISRKRDVVKNLVGGVGAILKSYGIDVVSGRGELTAPGRILSVMPDGSSKEYQGKNVILATGSRPTVLPFIDVDGKMVQTTDEALDSEDIPDRIVIIGGGVIGMEMASIYLNLGCSVTILELLPDILMTEDDDVRKLMRSLLIKKGAELQLKAKARDVKTKKNKLEIAFEDHEGKVSTVNADRLLLATGRSPVLDGIDHRKLGLGMDGPFVKVNSRLETNLKNVYAIGDLVGGMMLAHKASAEAEAAVANISGGKKEVQPRLTPRCIWGLTEVGAAGLSEAEAKAAGYKIKTGKFPFINSGAARAMGNTEGFVKIVGDTDTGEILGVHIIGEHATDLIGECVTAMTMEASVEDLAETIKPHPTLSENIMEAALDWNSRAIHSPKKR